MDSIVDGFAPIIHGIEVEVDEIESLVSGLNEDEVQALQAERGARLMITNDRPAETTDPEKRSGIADAVVDLASPDPEKARHLSPIKETANVTSRGRKSRFLDLTDLSLPPRLRSFIARIRWDRLVECQNPDSILVRLLRLKPNPGAESSTTVDVLASKDRRTTGYKVLLRMAASRRLVTSLMRVLAPKNEVIVQIRKRLQTPGGLIWPHQTSNGKDGSGSGLGIRSGSTSGVELDIYLGDVQGANLIQTMSAEMIMLITTLYSRSYRFYAAGSGALRAYLKPSSPRVPLATTLLTLERQRQYRQGRSRPNFRIDGYSSRAGRNR